MPVWGTLLILLLCGVSLWTAAKALFDLLIFEGTPKPVCLIAVPVLLMIIAASITLGYYAILFNRIYG